MKSILHRKSAKGQSDPESIQLHVSGEYTAVPVQDEAYGLEVDSRSVTSSSLFSQPTTMTYDKNKLSELFNAVDFSSHAKVIELLTQDPALLIVRDNYTDHSELADSGNGRQFIDVSPWMLMLWMLDFRLIHLVLDHFKSNPSFDVATVMYEQYDELKLKGLEYNYRGATQTSPHFDLKETVLSYDAFINYVTGRRQSDAILQLIRKEHEEKYIEHSICRDALTEKLKTYPYLSKSIFHHASKAAEDEAKMKEIDEIMEEPAYDYSMLATLWNNGEKSVSNIQLLWPVWILSVFSCEVRFCADQSFIVWSDVIVRDSRYAQGICYDNTQPPCEPVEYYQKYAIKYALVHNCNQRNICHRDDNNLIQFNGVGNEFLDTLTLNTNIGLIRKQRDQLDQLSTCLSTHFTDLQPKLEELCVEEKINKRSCICVMM